LAAHYLSTIDFSPQIIREQQSALHRIYKTLEKAQSFSEKVPTEPEEHSSEAKAVLNFSKTFESIWNQAMDDDFNSAKVFGLVFDYVRLINTMTDKKSFRPTTETQNLLKTFTHQMGELSKVLNLFGESPTQFLNLLRDLHLKEKNLSRDHVEELISKRIEARKQKDFRTSDSIRDELLNLGIEVMDQGTQSSSWDIRFD
jgi:cysteinyl-tRNA synthetase